MYTETLKANSYGKMNRLATGSLRLFNLPWLFEKMKLKRTWMKSELDSKILVNRPDKQVVLTTIHEDTKIDSFQSDASVTLQVIGGKLKLHTRKESIILKEGQFLKLHEKINYSFTTRKESVFLLTIVNGRNRQKFE
jgi:quercetin dioxygenase-like cupin family protein